MLSQGNGSPLSSFTKVYVLVHEQPRDRALEDAFLSQGKEAHLFVDPSTLYKQIENGGKGIVLISRNARHNMARIIPDFIVGRFHLPVILFQESQVLPLAFQKEAITSKPEIIQIDGGPVEMIEFMKDFENNYLREIDPKASLPKLRTLRMTSEGVFEKLHSLFEKKRPMAPSPTVQIASFKIRDPKGLGFFVFGIPIRKVGPVSQQQLDQIQSFLQNSLFKEIEIKLMKESVKHNFFQDLKGNSDHSISGEMQGTEMIALYFSNLPEANLQKEYSFHEELALVQVEQWWKEIPLPCNAYLWMNKSGKRILYVKAAGTMTEESFDRFLKNGIKHLAITVEDVPQFQTWRELVSLSQSKASTVQAA